MLVLLCGLFYEAIYALHCVILFLPRLGKRELILVLFVRYVCSICACLVLSVSSSSSCFGRAAVCDCGTP